MVHDALSALVVAVSELRESDAEMRRVMQQNSRAIALLRDSSSPQPRSPQRVQTSSPQRERAAGRPAVWR